MGSKEFGLAQRTDHHRAAVTVPGLRVSKALRLIMAVILFFYCCPHKRQIRVKIAEHKNKSIDSERLNDFVRLSCLDFDIQCVYLVCFISQHGVLPGLVLS